MIKASEIRELTLSELQERLDAERERLHRLKINHSISPLENPMELRVAKKNIARMLTIQTERLRKEAELAKAKEAAAKATEAEASK